MNAMDPEMIFELTVAAAWLADRAPFRALIVTGSGRAFSAGGDVNWFMKGLEDPEHDLPSDVRRGAEVLHQAIVDFRRIPYPRDRRGQRGRRRGRLLAGADVRPADRLGGCLLRGRLRPHRGHRPTAA